MKVNWSGGQMNWINFRVLYHSMKVRAKALKYDCIHSIFFTVDALLQYPTKIVADSIVMFGLEFSAKVCSHISGFP